MQTGNDRVQRSTQKNIPKNEEDKKKIAVVS